MHATSLNTGMQWFPSRQHCAHLGMIERSWFSDVLRSSVCCRPCCTVHRARDKVSLPTINTSAPPHHPQACRPGTPYARHMIIAMLCLCELSFSILSWSVKDAAHSCRRADAQMLSDLAAGLSCKSACLNDPAADAIAFMYARGMGDNTVFAF